MAATTHDAAIRCCGTQVGLKQPSGHADRVRQSTGLKSSVPNIQYSVVHSEAGGRQCDDPNCGDGPFAEPNRQPHHQTKRREGGEPGQSDIGFPAAGANVSAISAALKCQR